ncbi:Uncharacterised protein [Bordetella pertussis]|nr:Uncharacterised protein [Bordetella pertussis]CFV95464.1 Uncharacterised protein [Bordetella pertussis]CFW28811.1 Uncharacterised protein [Bordetella pertussis]
MHGSQGLRGLPKVLCFCTVHSWQAPNILFPPVLGPRLPPPPPCAVGVRLLMFRIASSKPTGSASTTAGPIPTTPQVPTPPRFPLSPRRSGRAGGGPSPSPSRALMRHRILAPRRRPRAPSCRPKKPARCSRATTPPTSRSTWRPTPIGAASTAACTATRGPRMPTWAIRRGSTSKPGWWPRPTRSPRCAPSWPVRATAHRPSTSVRPPTPTSPSSVPGA